MRCAHLFEARSVLLNCYANVTVRNVTCTKANLGYAKAIRMAYCNSVVYIKVRFGLLKLYISSLNVFVISLTERKLNVSVQRCQGALLRLQNSDSALSQFVKENMSNISRSHKQAVVSLDGGSVIAYYCVTLA